MKFVPFHYQPRMVNHMRERDVSALFCSPSMGKTACVLDVAAGWLLNGEVRGVLIVAPIRVCSITWPNQIRQWDHSSWMRVAHLRTPEGMKAWKDGSAEVYLINPEQLPKLVPLLFTKKNLAADAIIIDECFPAGTLVDTPTGKTPIEKLKKGDCILNVLGEDSVVQTHRNKIHEVTIIHYGGSNIVTSSTHKFFTTRGWVEAKNLQKEDEILTRDEAMRVLLDDVRDPLQGAKSDLLREILRSEINRSVGQTQGGSSLQLVLRRIHKTVITPCKVLQHILFRKMEVCYSPSEADKRPCREANSGASRMVLWGFRKSNKGKTQDNSNVSDEKSRVSGEVKSYPKKNRSQGKSSRGEWSPAAESAEGNAGCARSWLDTGTCGEDQRKKRKWIPLPLQDRRCKSGQDDRYRSRWWFPQFIFGEDKRSKETEKIGSVRVDGVEVLQSSDPRLDCYRETDGFVYFYDITAERHPSYSVRGLLVHNCSLAKNPTSKRFNALRPYLPLFKKRVGLTGTPIPNNYLDLFAQIRMLDDGVRLGKSFHQYQRTYFESDFMGYKWSLRPGSKEIIDQKIADLALVMLGDDYLDIPTCSTVEVEVSLPPDAKAAYKTLEKELLLELEKSDVVALSAATLANKLLQMTSGSVYAEDKSVVHEIHSAKIDALKKLRKKHGKEPMLVLVGYKHESARILKAIPGSRMFDEKDLGAWQRGEIHTWLADYRSLSHGVDGIQKGGRIAVWMTLPWSNEGYMQTNARVVRTGQSNETIVYRIVAPGTLDDAVAESLREKSDTQSGMFNALKALQKLSK